MTSKEALLNIESFLAYEDFQEELKVIAKDFEVLAMLKHTLKIKKSDLYGFEIIVHGSDEEENKIKEWVEND